MVVYDVSASSLTQTWMSLTFSILGGMSQCLPVTDQGQWMATKWLIVNPCGAKSLSIYTRFQPILNKIPLKFVKYLAVHAQNFNQIIQFGRCQFFINNPKSRIKRWGGIDITTKRTRPPFMLKCKYTYLHIRSGPILTPPPPKKKVRPIS